MDYTVELDADGARDQTDEAVVITFADGRSERVRLHDYDRVYEIPGLYEQVVEQRLRCDSPSLLADVLVGAAALVERTPDALRVLDLGAGTGAMGRQLSGRGVEVLVGVDSVVAARDVTLNDRPDLYTEYLVCDADDLSELAAAVQRRALNCLVCASALGANHIKARSFEALWNLFAPGALFAINVNEKLVETGASEIGEYLRSLRAPRSGTEIVSWERFRHRVSVNGTPIHYIAIAAHKHDAS
jgi:SAM-dependent methyltransferase